MGQLEQEDIASPLTKKKRRRNEKSGILPYHGQSSVNCTARQGSKVAGIRGESGSTVKSNITVHRREERALAFRSQRQSFLPAANGDLIKTVVRLINFDIIRAGPASFAREPRCLFTAPTCTAEADRGKVISSKFSGVVRYANITRMEQRRHNRSCTYTCMRSHLWDTSP